MFIKDYIARDINTARGDIKALVPFVEIAISYEDALFRAKLELMLVDGPKVWPYRTTKNAEKIIIGFNIKQAF